MPEVRLNGYPANRNYLSDTTDENGSFIFSSIPDSTYTLRVRAEGYGERTTGSFRMAGQDVTYDIKLLPVAFGVVTGKVTDSLSGSAIRGAVVALRQGNATNAIDTVGDEGTFQFDQVPTGVYSLRVSASSYIQKQVDSVVVMEDSAINVSILLGMVAYASLRGIVTDSSADPQALKGAIVTVRCTGFPTRRDTADASGAYFFDSIPSGTYTVSISHPGFAGKNASYHAAGGVDTIDFQLRSIPTATIEGSVLDAITDEPLPGAVLTVRAGVNVSTGTALYVATADSLGFFRFTFVPTGDYTIRVQLAGYMSRNFGVYFRDTSRIILNARISPDPVGVSSSVAGSRAHGRITLHSATLTISGMNDVSRVSVYTLEGRLVTEKCFSEVSDELSISGIVGSRMYLLRITQRGTTRERLIHSLLK